MSDYTPEQISRAVVDAVNEWARWSSVETLLRLEAPQIAQDVLARLATPGQGDGE